MRLDQYSNPIFNQQDIFDALYKGKKLSPDLFVEPSDDTKSLEAVMDAKFWLPLDEYDCSVNDYDASMQSDWNMPDAYKTMDIEGFLVNECPKQHYQRLIEELQEFRARNMLDLLRWLKYFVDTCRANNVIWGVGRGSSVASYALFLLGVHKIDSIKYNLDWHEFLR